MARNTFPLLVMIKWDEIRCWAEFCAHVTSVVKNTFSYWIKWDKIQILCSCDKCGQAGGACVFLDTLPQSYPGIFKINHLLFQPLNKIQITWWAQFCDICMVRRVGGICLPWHPASALSLESVMAKYATQGNVQMPPRPFQGLEVLTLQLKSWSSVWISHYIFGFLLAFELKVNEATLYTNLHSFAVWQHTFVTISAILSEQVEVHLLHPTMVV